jgi:hypothetical protein
MFEVAGRDYDVASPCTAAVAHQGEDPEQHDSQHEEVHQ